MWGDLIGRLKSPLHKFCNKELVLIFFTIGTVKNSCIFGLTMVKLYCYLKKTKKLGECNKWK